MTALATSSSLRWSARELGALTRRHAASFFAGQYPFVTFEAERRWHRRVYCDDEVDVWLLSWLPTQGTALHDHGGSSGAFTVLDGELTEWLPGRGAGASTLTARRRRALSTTTFGPRHVHDVVNRGSLPAVSVHAYSPPLTAMRFFDLVPGSGLVATRTVRTDDPEPALVGQS